MLEASPVGRAGTPDEVANVAALLMGEQGALITGSDILRDGGVTASYRFGELAPAGAPSTLVMGVVGPRPMMSIAPATGRR
jgi:hypothetical protein